MSAQHADPVRGDLVGILVDAIPPPDKLRLLADWIDVKYPNDSNREVQRDLRVWARLADYALGAYEAALTDGSVSDEA